MANLEKYNQKRNFNKTKEPQGRLSKPKKNLRFVVQHHLASHDHFDFRLEYEGILKSFAIPKGPSYNPKDKRLAVLVEDHPLSYRDFEGTIPKGEYGGGTVMLFDYGTWQAIDNKSISFEKTLKFTLKGKRLHGTWSLIPLKDNNYLLIKENDKYANYCDIKKYNTSIKTGRTIKEISQDKVINSKKDYLVNGITITNPNKIISKKPKITKYDIALYYQKVSINMLPLIENRILSTIRTPKGIEGEKFFKKHYDSSKDILPKTYLKNKNGKKIDYYYLTNPKELISEVNMNGYEFHTWSSQVGKLNYPDIIVFDLDPDKDVTLTKLRNGVKDLKSILDELKLKSFLKTSGKKGYHVVVPLHKKYSWKKVTEIARNIATLMATKWPDRYTANIRLKNREGKIFIDWQRNIKGSTSVAPYSLRISKKITVSMPISWQELDKVKPNSITIEEALKRLKRKDPWKDFFS